jgi:TolA-binding protein
MEGVAGPSRVQVDLVEVAQDLLDGIEELRQELWRTRIEIRLWREDLERERSRRKQRSNACAAAEMEEELPDLEDDIAREELKKLAKNRKEKEQQEKEERQKGKGKGKGKGGSSGAGPSNAGPSAPK